MYDGDRRIEISQLENCLHAKIALTIVLGVVGCCDGAGLTSSTGASYLFG